MLKLLFALVFIHIGTLIYSTYQTNATVIKNAALKQELDSCSYMFDLCKNSYKSACGE